jgi:acetyltransferase-like isoleucine patch superfamily enzyme
MDDRPMYEHPGFRPNPYNPHAWIIGEPEIGEGTWIGAFTVIDGSGGLRIGRGCDVSCGVHIYTHSTVRRCVSGRAYDAIDRQPVVVGDYVFIGANAVLMMGVTIGDRAVIAAGAVVTTDVAPATIVGGVPARPVGRVEGEGAQVQLVTGDR